MTVFDQIRKMNIDEFAEWFNDHCSHDTDPCVEWWNNTYCKNCNPELGTIEGTQTPLEFAWCELHKKCRFFPNMECIPDSLEMTKIWLKSKSDV